MREPLCYNYWILGGRIDSYIFKSLPTKADISFSVTQARAID